ncbi:NifX-associated nitrogen fixation protein [Pseudomaricurvus sp. HS19]|uniref:NifX-associated nitrogen fixation protein n=1 Tax=Pseudomaricurvus sp. HS19 TaxID=2692626 RepID=UPI0013689E27|nr:NifX-associated nitrogen fixation protein [Pseudomaricurvus sp. HS19]MYM62485.1 NifX-associated nitrogen fixation protein [Pseudomaricurvus sp. HS19]
MNDLVLTENEALMEHPIVRQVVTQLRALDSYGTYDTWPDYKVLDPMILTKERRREIPVVGDPDEIVISRLKAYYNSIAAGIERECELMAVPFVNLSHEGFGKALILVGRLVAVNKTLRDVHRFGFDSLPDMVADMEKIVGQAVDLIKAHREVAEL